MNPLDELRDIHLPGDVSWWPIAPGWWLLLLLAVFFGLLLYKKFRQRGKPMSARAVRQALHMVNKLERQKDDRAYVRAISRLLRRSAISCYGRERISGLSGEAWLNFLDRKGNTTDFTSGKGRVLLDLPYQKQGAFDRAGLTVAVKKWLKTQGKVDYA